MNADTIAVGASDTIYWNRVDQADYYAITIPFLTSYQGSSLWRYRYEYAIDTFFVVTGAMHPDSTLLYDVGVTPFCGPDPRTGRSNWTGNFLAGTVYSIGGFTHTRIHISQPILGAGHALSSTTEDRPEVTPSEMVANLYKKYRR
jgi:hypothetical protein